MGYKFKEVSYVRSKLKKIDLPGTHAGTNHIGSNTAQVSVDHGVVGSGPRFFGGADSWPVVSLQLSYPTGWEGNAELFAQKLAQFVEVELKAIVDMRVEQGELTKQKAATVYADLKNAGGAL